MTANDTSTIETTEAVNPDGELRQGLFAAQAARIVELQAEIATLKKLEDLAASVRRSPSAWARIRRKAQGPLSRYTGMRPLSDALSRAALVSCVA